MTPLPEGHLLFDTTVDADGIVLHFDSDLVEAFVALDPEKKAELRLAFKRTIRAEAEIAAPVLAERVRILEAVGDGAPAADPPREPPAPAADAGDGDGSTPPPAVRRSPPAGSSPARRPRNRVDDDELAQRVRDAMRALGRGTMNAVMGEAGLSSNPGLNSRVRALLEGNGYVVDGDVRGRPAYRLAGAPGDDGDPRAGQLDHTGPPPLPGLPPEADHDPRPAASIERRIKAALRSKPLGASHAEIRDRVNADGNPSVTMQDVGSAIGRMTGAGDLVATGRGAARFYRIDRG